MEGHAFPEVHAVLGDHLHFPVEHGREQDRVVGMEMDDRGDLSPTPIDFQMDRQLGVESPFSVDEVAVEVDAEKVCFPHLLKALRPWLDVDNPGLCLERDVTPVRILCQALHVKYAVSLRKPCLCFLFSFTNSPPLARVSTSSMETQGRKCLLNQPFHEGHVKEPDKESVEGPPGYEGSSKRHQPSFSPFQFQVAEHK